MPYRKLLVTVSACVIYQNLHIDIHIPFGFCGSILPAQFFFINKIDKCVNHVSSISITRDSTIFASVSFSCEIKCLNTCAPLYLTETDRIRRQLRDGTNLSLFCIDSNRTIYTYIYLVSTNLYGFVRINGL